jgi:hypothetical protein
MNKMQEHLLRAGNELGIKVIVPFELSLASGKKLSAEALLPELSNPKGIIVSQSMTDFLAICDELKKLGYGLSVYAEPSSNEKYDVENYKEMFIEWGWSGDKAKKPDWM